MKKEDNKTPKGCVGNITQIEGLTYGVNGVLIDYDIYTE